MFLNTVTDQINRLLLRGAQGGITENQFFAAEIKEWKDSNSRKEQMLGDLYYEGRQDIQDWRVVHEKCGLLA